MLFTYTIFDKNVCYGYDIPYIGGYSKDKKTIYIDCDFKWQFTDTRGIVHNILDALILHESIECMLLDTHTFNDSHKIALAAEGEYLKQRDIPIDEYYHHIYKHVDARLQRSYIEGADLPPDLDMTPYIEDGILIKAK